jgi:hypothetical protein
MIPGFHQVVVTVTTWGSYGDDHVVMSTDVSSNQSLQRL